MPREKSINCRKDILIINKDYEQSNFIEDHLKSYGCNVFIVDNFDSLICNKIQANVVFINLMQFKDDKTNILKNIAEKIPTVPIIVQMRKEDLKVVLYFLRDRVFKFFLNIVLESQICDSILSILEKNLLSKHLVEDLTLNSFITASPQMNQVLDLAWKAVGCSNPLIIEGEFGVGKTRLANSIHASGERALFPFVILNCRIIDQDRIEQVLFGDVDLNNKNNTQYLGKFIEANGGTIVLEESAKLPIRVQGRISNFIETGKIEFFDSRNTISLDVRLIFIAEKNLLQENNNNFSKDLYYKISNFVIKIPALRDRILDIPLLVRFFLELFSKKNNINRIDISEEALSILTDYKWPDNVEELKNIILRSLIGLEKNQITADHFLYLSKNKEQNIPSIKLDDCYTRNKNRDIIVEHDNLSNVQNSIVAIRKDGEIRRLSDVEKDMIILAIELYQSQMSEIARRLGIGRSTLYRKIKEYNIEVNSV
ncbi:sigma-54-dependent transcriptional regulator [Candidatus Liberibacter brunswickensis]|uniref:sigma-54-dependent transcriptional regulator n=1 Tax=Candidatus Liberibacter brunswickensis TaxID=1968796 RepID=UPI002FE13198